MTRSPRRRHQVTVCAAVVVLLLAPVSCSSGKSSERAAGRTATSSTTAVPDRLFRDPQGDYELTTDPSWQRLPAQFIAEVEAWSIGPPSSGFRPNVNVLAQEFAGSTPEDYVELTRQSGAGQMTLEAAEVIELADGRKAARFVLSQVQGGLTLRSLGIAVTRQGLAVLATLTTVEDDFEHYRETTEPLLRTLRLLGV